MTSSRLAISASFILFVLLALVIPLTARAADRVILGVNPNYLTTPGGTVTPGLNIFGFTFALPWLNTPTQATVAPKPATETGVVPTHAGKVVLPGAEPCGVLDFSCQVRNQSKGFDPFGIVVDNPEKLSAAGLAPTPVSTGDRYYWTPTTGEIWKNNEQIGNTKDQGDAQKIINIFSRESGYTYSLPVQTPAPASFAATTQQRDKEWAYISSKPSYSDPKAYTAYTETLRACAYQNSSEGCTSAQAAETWRVNGAGISKAVGFSLPTPVQTAPQPLTGGTTATTASIPGGSEFECAEMYPDAYGSYLVCLQNGNAQSGPSATGGTSQTDFMTNCQASGESEYSCGLKLKFQSASSADQPQSTTPASQIQITDSQNRFCMGSASGRTGIDTTVYNDCVQWVKDNPDAIVDNSNSTDGGGTGSAPYRADDSAFTGYTPGPAPAPVRATEFVNGGIYSNGRLIEMRDPNSPEANLAPTFVVPDWVPFSGFLNRSVFQIPESALSAQQAPAQVEERQAPTPRPYTRDEENALSRGVEGTAEESRFTPSGPVRSDDSGRQQDTSCHTGIFSFLNRWNGCDSGNAAPEPQQSSTQTSGFSQIAPAQSGPVQQYQPYNENIEYPGNEYYGAPIDANIDSNKDDVLNVEDYVNEYYRLNPPAEPETTTNDDYLWWQSPYIQRVTDPAGNDVDWTEYYGGEEFLYIAPTRQFSQAEPSNPLQNQSLAASVLMALNGQ